jgi:glycosyltransferase involved in cell wall biosynthesis
MRLVLVADAFPPMRSSASIQLWDLAVEIKRLGHEMWVLVPSSDISQSSVLEEMDGINVLRLKAHKTKDISYIKRAVNEFLMPFLMIKHYRTSQVKEYRWDGVIWYSPTIFLGPVAWYLKKKSGCKAYLILRDIFPKWALDLGLIKKGPAYYLFCAVERFQYYIADAIGIQSKFDLNYFSKIPFLKKEKISILNNWLSPASEAPCSILISETSLSGRKICIYAGNMGAAQNIYPLLEVANGMKEIEDIGFLFVGRGSQIQELKKYAQRNELVNTLFFDEIPHEEIPSLYRQCHIGLIALDEKHTTSNIPGKFISYLRSGLPVFAIINYGNELMEIIEQNLLGKAIECGHDAKFYKEKLLSIINTPLERGIPSGYFTGNYRADVIASRIVAEFGYIESLIND